MHIPPKYYPKSKQHSNTRRVPKGKSKLIQKKVNSQVKNAFEKFISKEKEIPRILNDILDKEQLVRNRMGLDE